MALRQNIHKRKRAFNWVVDEQTAGDRDGNLRKLKTAMAKKAMISDVEESNEEVKDMNYWIRKGFLKPYRCSHATFRILETSK
jgi:hypothetical protein